MTYQKSAQPARVLSPNPTEPRPDVTFAVPGEPVSKSRHKTGVRNGRVFHYKDSQNAQSQDLISVYYRQARGPGRPLAGGFGVNCTFYVKKRQRRDVDNFIKLVFDGLTGVAWIDDSQVTEVHGRVVHGSDDPRSVIQVFPTSDLPDHLVHQCEFCGQDFRTYTSWGNAKKYCSPECRQSAVRSRRERTCKHCSQTFHTTKAARESPFCSVSCKNAFAQVEVTCSNCAEPKVISRTRYRKGTNNFFCDEKCRADHWRKVRKANAKGTCGDCGGPTSKKNYTRCRACALDVRRKKRAA